MTSAWCSLAFMTGGAISSYTAKYRVATSFHWMRCAAFAVVAYSSTPPADGSTTGTPDAIASSMDVRIELHDASLVWLFLTTAVSGAM